MCFGSIILPLRRTNYGKLTPTFLSVNIKKVFTYRFYYINVYDASKHALTSNIKIQGHVSYKDLTLANLVGVRNSALHHYFRRTL